MRDSGLTLREIAETTGYSHEYVRMFTNPEGYYKAKAAEAEALKAKRAEQALVFTQWLKEHGPVTRDEFCAAHGMDRKELTIYISGGLLAREHFRSPPKEPEIVYTDDDYIAAIQRAWAELQRLDPSATLLSAATYELLRGFEDPSKASMAKNGRWVMFCDKAGVPHGTGRKAYIRKWPDLHSCLPSVRLFIEQAKKNGAPQTYNEYYFWSQFMGADHPSGPTLRNRMQETEYVTWNQVLDLAKSEQ